MERSRSSPQWLRPWPGYVSQVDFAKVVACQDKLRDAVRNYKVREQGRVRIMVRIRFRGRLKLRVSVRCNVNVV